MWMPKIGDRFYHPPHAVPLTCDRKTKTADGTRYLWSGNTAYPLEECWPSELLNTFVQDLANASTWQAVEAITSNLPPGGRELIWAATPRDLRARLWALRSQHPQGPTLRTANF